MANDPGIPFSRPPGMSLADWMKKKNSVAPGYLGVSVSKPVGSMLPDNRLPNSGGTAATVPMDDAGIPLKFSAGLKRSLSLRGEKQSPSASGSTVQAGTPAANKAGVNWNNVLKDTTKVADAAAPFASNIINSFRKPPKPRMGKAYDSTALETINLSDERNKISTLYAAANRSTERNVDANTAEAVKAFNRGDEIAKLNTINEREKNMNVAIRNEKAKMDAGVSAANTGLVNKFRDEQVQRNVADQREQSANIANAGDKLMMIRNEKSKERTELEKANVLATGLYGQSGVLERARARMKAAGLPDPMRKDYKDLDEKKYGGYMGRMPKRKIA